MREMNHILDEPEQQQPKTGRLFSVLSFASAIFTVLFLLLLAGIEFMEWVDPSAIDLLIICACATCVSGLFSVMMNGLRKEPESVFRRWGNILNLTIFLGSIVLFWILVICSLLWGLFTATS